MHYFLNYSLVDINSSIEHAALMRLKLFKQNDIPAKYVTVNWDYLNHLRIEQYDIAIDDVINMYEYFANVQNIRTTTAKALENLPLDSELIWDGDGNQADVTEADTKRAHIDYTPALVQVVGKITYQNRFFKPYRRDYWDARGFLSRAEILSASGNIMEEILYDAVTQQPVLTKHYHVADGLMVMHQIDLTFKGVAYQFTDENALIAFFLKQLALDEPASTIYVDRPSLAEPAVLMGHNAKKVLMVPTLHAQDPQNQATSNLDNNYYYAIYQHLADFDTALVATEAQARDLRTWLGGNPDDVTSTVTPIYAVSRAITGLVPRVNQPRSKKLIYAGLLNNYDALKDIVVAFTKVKNDYPDATLVMAGFSEAYNKLKAEVEEHQLADIVFTGYLNQTDLVDQLASASLFISTHTGDAQPLAMIQALEQGTPVISYDFNYGPGLIADSPAVQTLTARKRSILTKQISNYYHQAEQANAHSAALLAAEQYNTSTVLAQYRTAGLV